MLNFHSLFHAISCYSEASIFLQAEPLIASPTAFGISSENIHWISAAAWWNGWNLVEPTVIEFHLRNADNCISVI